MSQSYAGMLPESEEFRLLDEALDEARRRPKSPPPLALRHQPDPAGLAAVRRSLPRPFEDYRHDSGPEGATAALRLAARGGAGGNESTPRADERRALLAAIISLLQEDLRGPAQDYVEAGRPRRRRRRRRGRANARPKAGEGREA